MHNGSGNVPFVDTVCNMPTFKDHVMAIDCHYDEMNRLIELNNRFTHIVPYPFGKQFKSVTPSPPPLIFRLPDYIEKLNNTKRVEVYDQYSIIYIHETIASGTPFTPLYRISAINTNIMFFQATFDTKLPQSNPTQTRAILENNTYSINNAELTRIKGSVMPTNFNWKDNVDITRPLEQGSCGSCWAVSASTCLSDVFVASKRVTNPNLSPGYILSCYPQKQCEGGNPYLAMNDLYLHGARSSECIPLTLPIQPCKCKSEGPAYFPKDIKVVCIPPDLSKYSKLDAELIQSHLNKLYGTDTTVNLSMVSTINIQKIIKDHIYIHGPVIGGFHLFKNFIKGDFRESNDIYMETFIYQGVPGIDYSDMEKDWVGSHAVVIVGWGEREVNGVNIPYWICRNSWGEAWGIYKGYFNIAMYPYNSVSQFEYPSLIVSELGHGLTGGVIMVKAGDIRYDTPIQQTLVKHVYSKSYTTNLAFMFMLLLGISVIIMMKSNMSITIFIISIVIYIALFIVYFANI